jgi:mono/diheme cytochrome c family protein
MYQTGPGWLFLTGDEADIILLRKKLGLYIEEIQDGSNDHNLSLIIGNQATGRWMKRSPFENSYVLATQIGSWLHNWTKPSQDDMKSYANAPALRQHLSKGETLYRTRCSACHTIGGGDIMKPDEGKVGPDLLGVLDKRPRLWMERWLAEPDKMLAEKDPIASRLFTKYRKLPMPNMKLNELEVDNLIDYIDKESRRVEKMQQNKVAVSVQSPKSTKPCCMPEKQEPEGSSGSQARSQGGNKMITIQ